MIAASPVRIGSFVGLSASAGSPHVRSRRPGTASSRSSRTAASEFNNITGWQGSLRLPPTAVTVTVSSYQNITEADRSSQSHTESRGSSRNVTKGEELRAPRSDRLRSNGPAWSRVVGAGGAGA